MLISRIRQAIQLWLWSREIHKEAWSRVKPFGVKRGSYEYKLAVQQVANENLTEIS